MVPGERGSGNTVRSERLDQQNLLNALRTAHRAIDKLKLDRIQELETSDFQGAETICRELIRLEEDRAAMGPGVTDDTTILEYKDKLAELLMSQRRYIEAEVIARDMRREWERLRGETSKPARTSLLQLCRALRGPKPVESYRMKYIEAEEIHRRIWWFSREESDKYWRVQNGYEFALVIAEQNRCKEAVVVYGEVMQAERAIADIQPDERSAILDSRHKLGEILCREKEFDDAASILKLVWEERRSIATGEALATSLGKLAKWEEEENVWRWLCEARRRDPGLPEDDPKLIEYRLNYGKVLLKRKNFAASVIQFRQTLDRRNQERLNADDCENLHCYCQAQVGNGEYAAAEGVIRKVWQKRQLILPDRDRDKCTMESCHLYGVVLLRRRRFQAAENILSQVSNLRRVHNGADHVDALESSLEYGNSLREQNDTDKWLAARNVFLEAWNFRDLHSIRAQPAIAYDTILEIGCSLARTMRKLGAYPQARSLMEDVLDRKEMQRPGIAAPPPGNGGTPPGQEEPGSVEVVEVESEESTGKHGGKKKKKVKDGKKGKSGKKGKDETKGKDGSKGKDGTKRKGETRRSRYPLQIGVQLEVSGG
jgi:tetratricopeptide (TPR) repeat protein